MSEGTQTFMIVMIYYDLRFSCAANEEIGTSCNLKFQISNRNILTHHDNHENLRSVFSPTFAQWPAK